MIDANEVLLKEGYLYAAIIDDSDKPLRVHVKYICELVRPCKDLDRSIKDAAEYCRVVGVKIKLVIYEEIVYNKQWTSSGQAVGMEALCIELIAQ